MSYEDDMFKQLAKDTTSSNIRQFLNQLPDILAMQPILAAIAYTRYIALIGAGFNKDTALEICKEIFK